MSIDCAMEDDDAAWWWSTDGKLYTYSNAHRGKRCCSCKQMVRHGESHILIARCRDPKDDLEERIHGVEVELAPWVICAICAPAFMKLYDMNVHMVLGQDNALDLLKEFEAHYRPGSDFRLKLPVLSF